MQVSCLYFQILCRWRATCQISTQRRAITLQRICLKDLNHIYEPVIGSRCFIHCIYFLTSPKEDFQIHKFTSLSVLISFKRQFFDSFFRFLFATKSILPFFEINMIINVLNMVTTVVFLLIYCRCWKNQQRLCLDLIPLMRFIKVR